MYTMSRSEYDQNVSTLKAAADAYANRAESLMTDGEYDLLFAEVAAVEAQHPEWVATNGGVSESVDAGMGSAGEIAHEWPMLSLENTYNTEEVEKFVKRAPEGTQFIVEPKFDGIAASVLYVDGVRQTISSRGDGKSGEDYSNASVAINGLPETIPGLTGHVEVRGEIVLNQENFEEVNAIREAHGEKPLANKRNGVAGLMRATSKPYKAPVSFFGYDVKPDVEDVHGWLAQHDIQSMGAESVAGDEVVGVLDNILAKSALEDVPMDGAVIKVVSQETREALGFTTRFPRWAVAYKFPIREVSTDLLDVEWAVGRTGIVTPRARLTPTEVMGSVIEYSTLHNLKYIRDRDLMIGDKVLLYKAGYVIPRIPGRLDVPRSGSEVEIVPPTHCPGCDTKLILSEGLILRCPNRECENSVRKLVHATGRGALDVDGLGETVITQMVENLSVARLDDLFHLTVEEIASLERMGEKSAQKIVDNLEDVRKNGTLEQFITSLGLKTAGKSLAGELGSVAGDFKGLLSLTADDLIGSVRSVKDKKAAHIIASIQDAKATIEGLLALGVNPKSTFVKPEVVTEGKLFGETVVVTGKATGTLAGLPRDEVTAKLKSEGAAVASSVNGKVTLVIAGEGGGSKRAKAEEKGIRVISFEEYDAL